MVIQKIRGKLWDLQSKYNYEGINELLNMCTYLDSRFKSMQIEDGTSITLTISLLAWEGIKIIKEKTSQPASDVLVVHHQKSQKLLLLSARHQHIIPPNSVNCFLGWRKQLKPMYHLVNVAECKWDVEKYESLSLLDSELDPLTVSGVKFTK